MEQVQPPAHTTAASTTADQRLDDRDKSATVPADQLQQYLLEPKANDLGTIIPWWKAQRDRLSVLNRIAMKVYLILSMSSSLKEYSLGQAYHS